MFGATIRADGSVSEVKTQVYPDRGAQNRPFEREVTGTLAKWKFTPGEREVRTGCYDILFKFKD